MITRRSLLRISGSLLASGFFAGCIGGPSGPAETASTTTTTEELTPTTTENPTSTQEPTPTTTDEARPSTTDEPTVTPTEPTTVSTPTLSTGRSGESRTAAFPEWLHADVECEGSNSPQEGNEHKTSLSLESSTDEPTSDSATIAYESLSPGVQMLVDFALTHESAETCVYRPKPFDELVAEMREVIGNDEDIPQHLYIEKRGMYYEARFYSGDMYFFPR